MKKGMTVVLDNNDSYILVDSVTYSGDKYFASVKKDDSDKDLYFFKLIKENDEEKLELLDSNEYANVIEALTQHIKNTF